MLTKEIKKNQVERLSESFKKAKGSFLVNCIGLNVEEMTALRKNLKNQNSDIKVIRNTLARRALEAHDKTQKAYESHLEGSNAFVLVFGEDISKIAKVINEAEEEYKAFQIKCGLSDDHFMQAQEIKSLAKLPSRDILQAQLLSLLLTPARQFLGACKEVPAGMVRILNSKKEQS